MNRSILFWVTPQASFAGFFLVTKRSHLHVFNSFVELTTGTTGVANYKCKHTWQAFAKSILSLDNVIYVSKCSNSRFVPALLAWSIVVVRAAGICSVLLIFDKDSQKVLSASLFEEARCTRVVLGSTNTKLSITFSPKFHSLDSWYTGAHVILDGEVVIHSNDATSSPFNFAVFWHFAVN